MKPSPKGSDGMTLHTSAEERAIRESVTRICQSTGFQKSERMRRFLTYAVDRRLANDLDSLKEYVVALEVFDRPAEYNPKVDALVRVEARRLRARLNEYYASEGSSDAVRIELASGSYVPVITLLAEEAKTPPIAGIRTPKFRWFVIAGAVLLLVVAWVSFALRSRRRPERQVQVTRVINDSNASFDPAVSRDGSLMAYASDQSGNIDLWLRPLSGGPPRRLTSHPAADTSPDFSPDNREIVFRSAREGGGVYSLQLSNGSERLMAPLGRSPKFSPDGQWIAYWTGEEHHFEGKVFVIPAGGGEPRRVASSLPDARWPIWSDDGKELLVYGSQTTSLASGAISGPTDLFLAPLDGEAIRATGWSAVLRRAHIWPGGPVVWRADTLLFPATTNAPNDFSEMSQGVVNLWQVRLPHAKRRVEGEPHPVTFGAALERDPVILPNGELLYSSRNYSLGVFEASGSSTRMAFQGAKPVFASPGSYITPRISRDGSMLVALSDRSGSLDIWLKNLRTGDERARTSDRTLERSPVISRNGDSIYYGVRYPNRYPIYKVNSAGGPPVEVCTDCGTVADISPDGHHLLYHAGDPWSAYDLDLITGHRALIARQTGRTYSSRFSNDGRWISLLADAGSDATPRRIFVTRYTPGKLSPESEWTPVTDGLQRDGEAGWSDDDATLYFISERDGNRCLWAKHLDPHNKHPLSADFPVLHLHRMNPNILTFANPGTFSPSVGKGRLVFGAAEFQSAIYRLRWSE